MSDKEDETELQVDTELDNNVTVLKSMGIEDEEQIRGILRQTSNNLEVILSDDMMTLRGG